MSLDDGQAQGVERTHFQASGFLLAKSLPYPLFHFPRSLIGKGHRGNMPGRHAPFLDQPGDLAGDHAGLPGARPGQHQQRAIGVMHGFLLAGVELTHRAPENLGR